MVQAHPFNPAIAGDSQNDCCHQFLVMTAAHSVPRLDPLPEGLGGNFAEISVNFRLEG